jgi:hypothetical protein
MDVDDKIIAMLAIKDTTPMDPVAVVTRLKAMFPWLEKTVGAAVRQGDDKLSGFLIPFGGDTVVAVIPVHIPIPGETLERAIAMNWFWPEAAAEFQKSRSHLIISALSASNDPRLMRSNATKVTWVTAALADMLPSVGVYWVTAQNVITPEHFITDAKQAGEDGTPYDLWVATHFFPADDANPPKEIIVRSTGLATFTGREIECGPSAKEPGELGPMVRMVGWYVLDRRVEFNGGETVGDAERDYGTVDLGRTVVGSDAAAVYRIILEATDA